MNVVVGANYGVNIPIKMGQPVKLAIIKDGQHIHRLRGR